MGASLLLLAQPGPLDRPADAQRAVVSIRGCTVALRVGSIGDTKRPFMPPRQYQSCDTPPESDHARPATVASDRPGMLMRMVTGA